MTCAICGARIERAVLYGGRPVCQVCEDEAAIAGTGCEPDCDGAACVNACFAHPAAAEIARRIEERRSEAMRRSQGVLL